MVDDKVIRELAAEVTTGLLSILPGTSVAMKMLPDSSKRLVKKMFGVKKSASLEASIEEILGQVAKELLAHIGAERGSHEFGATYSGIEDFKASLSKTPLDAKLILDGLADPSIFIARLQQNCPEEHRKWASDLRRKIYGVVLHRFTAALLAIAPQIETVRTAMMVETYRLVAEQQFRNLPQDYSI